MKTKEIKMKKSAFSAAIFDLDGTVIDSMQDMLICMKAAYEKQGIYDAKPAKKHIGPALPECLRNITPKANPKLLESVADNYRGVYDKSTYPNTSLYPDIKELFLGLKAKKIPAYLVTNKRLAPTLRILKQKGLKMFKAVISPDIQQGRSLSKAEMLALLLKKEGLNPESAVYIGDSVPDIKSARVNGIRTIAVTYGYTAKAALKKAAPAFLVKDVKGLAKIILRG